MNEEDIIREVREKIKNNPKYVNPMSKQYQEDIKRYGFENGYRYSCWLQKVGILKNPTEVRQKQKDDWAKSIGFVDFNDYRNNWNYETGRSVPNGVNEDSATYLSEFTENFMIQKYPGAKKMPPCNPGFDYLWNGIKIDVKGSCIFYRIDRQPGFIFHVRHNHIADKFVLVGCDNRENMNPLFAWEFDKYDLVKYGIGKGFEIRNFWDREGIMIHYSEEGLFEFKDHQICIDEIIKEM